jgi:hypothetical protein
MVALWGFPHVRSGFCQVCAAHGIENGVVEGQGIGIHTANIGLLQVFQTIVLVLPMPPGDSGFASDFFMAF